MTALIEGMAGTGDDALVASAGPSAAYDTGTDLPLEAAPPKVSLLSTAFDATSVLDQRYGTGKWINGIAFEPEAGALDLAADYPYFWVCPPDVTQHQDRLWVNNSPGGIKQIPTEPTGVAYTPYMAHTADPCITTEGMFGRDGRGRAKRLLEANLTRIIENELWTGLRSTQAGWSNLSLKGSVTTTPNGTTATGFINALADLENAYFSLDNRPGFIHVQPRIVALWRAFDLIEPTPSGRALITALGNYVVPGVGYDGSGTGLAAGSHSVSWAYMTGPVLVARTPVVEQAQDYSQMIARTTNELNIRAEAYVAAFWDGKADVAVKIDHTDELS